MAERKKVKKTNPRQKVKNGAVGAPKRTPSTGSASLSKSRQSKKKSPERMPRPKPQTEQISMTSVDSPKREPVTKQSSRQTGGIAGASSAATRRPAQSPPARRVPSATRKPPEQKQRQRTELHPVKRRVAAKGPNLTVVLGNKLKARRKRLGIYAILIAVIGSIVAFCASAPTGPFERITNSFAVIGGGDYPASLSGTGVKALKQTNSKTFVLSNSHLDGFSASGKAFLSLQHNFSSPVLEVSHERTLVYNRESTGFLIANNFDILFEENLEFPIYTADIADNGSVAFATKASGYAAQVQVFSGSMKQKFTWYLVDGLISDVALSNNGKYLAVSVLKVKDGSFSSQIYCFRTNEEEPLFTIEQKGESVVSLETVSSRCFAYISGESLVFVNWKNGTETKADADGLSPRFFRVGADGIFAVFGETARSKIVKYNQKGIKTYELEYNGLIDDVALADERIYILRSNQIIALDSTGAELGNIPLDQKPFFISAMGKSVYSIDNLALRSHRFEMEEGRASSSDRK